MYYYSLEKRGIRHFYKFYEESFEVTHSNGFMYVDAFVETSNLINYATTTEIEVGSFVVSLLNDGFTEFEKLKSKDLIAHYIYNLNIFSKEEGSLAAENIASELNELVDIVFLSSNTGTNYNNYISHSNYIFLENEKMFSIYILESIPFHISSYFDDIHEKIREVYSVESLFNMICYEIILMIKHNIKLGKCPACNRYFIVHNNKLSCGNPLCQSKSAQAKFYKYPLNKIFYRERSRISSQQANTPTSNVNASEFTELYKDKRIAFQTKYDNANTTEEKEEIIHEFKKVSKMWVEEYREYVRQNINKQSHH